MFTASTFDNLWMCLLWTYMSLVGMCPSPSITVTVQVVFEMLVSYFFFLRKALPTYEVADWFHKNILSLNCLTEGSNRRNGEVSLVEVNKVSSWLASMLSWYIQGVSSHHSLTPWTRTLIFEWYAYVYMHIACAVLVLHTINDAYALPNIIWHV